MSDPENKDSQIGAQLPAVYEELRRIAASTMARHPADPTLQPTALVHEAWLRLGGAQQADWESEAHLLRAHAEAMRHVLIDRARQRSAIRHGGGLERIEIDHMDVPIDTEDEEQLIAVSAALEKLAVENPDAAELVKLRCFVGMDLDEAAGMLGISRRTAARRWQLATTWLYCNFRPASRSEE